MNLEALSTFQPPEKFIVSLVCFYCLHSDQLLQNIYLHSQNEINALNPISCNVTLQIIASLFVVEIKINLLRD